MVAESRRVVDTQKAGLIDIDEVQVRYPVIIVEFFKYGGGKGQQGVSVFCEPGVLNVRVAFYEMGCLANEPGVRGEEFIKIAMGAVESHTDVVGDILLLKAVNGQRKNCQQHRYRDKERRKDGQFDCLFILFW